MTSWDYLDMVVYHIKWLDQVIRSVDHIIIIFSLLEQKFWWAYKYMISIVIAIDQKSSKS